MYWPCYWICERLGITTKPREEAVEELMRFKEELTLSLLCKQTGRATRPLSPLKMKDVFQFQFVPTDENNHKVTILQMPRTVSVCRLLQRLNVFRQCFCKQLTHSDYMFMTRLTRFQHLWRWHRWICLKRCPDIFQPCLYEQHQNLNSKQDFCA